MKLDAQKSFAAEVYTAAREIGLSDAQARLAASQAALESGFGKRAPGNNYFGIKAGSSWQGPTQNLKTWEEVNGRRQNITDKFRAYDDPRDSLKDWVALMERRWPEAMAAPTFEDAVQGLRYGERGGYATDSRYGSKLNAINNRVNDTFELYDATNLANYAAQREQEIGGYPAGIAVPPADRLTQVAGSNWNATPTPEAKPSVPSFEVAAADPFEAVLGGGPSSRPRNSAASMEIPSAYQATGPASRPNNSRSAIDVPDIRQPVEGLSALPGVPVQASNPMQSAKTGPSMMEFGLSGVPDIMAGVNALTAQKELAIPDLKTPATDKALAKVQDRIAVPDAMQLEPVNQTKAQKTDKASKKGSGTGAVVGAIAGGLLGGGIPGALAGAKLGHKYGDQISGLIPDISGLTFNGIFPQGFVSPEGFAATPVGMASAAGNAATGGGAWDRGSQDAYWSAYAAGGGGDGAWDVAVASANERREANERNGGGKGLGDSISEAIGSWF